MKGTKKNGRHEGNAYQHYEGKGIACIKRMSLKVGLDLNKILSGATVADALL